MTSSPTLDLRFGGYIACVPTVAVLRQSIDPSTYQRGDAIIVSGNSDISDGQGGIYAWLPESIAPDDNFTVVAPLALNGHPGRWVLAVGPIPQLATLTLRIDDLTTSLNATAADLATLEGQVGDEVASRLTAIAALTASITSEQSVRATADEALASRTTTLEASYTAQQGVVSGLTGDVATNRASITDEATARANADSALATRTSTLEASTGNLSSRVTTTESAVSTLNGKTAAYWSVESVAGNNRAQLTVHADANAGAGVDIIGDVSISGDLLVEGTVTSNAIAPHAISDGDLVSSPSQTFGTSPVGITYTAYTVSAWLTPLTYSFTLTSAARVGFIAVWKQVYTNQAQNYAARLNLNAGTILDETWGAAYQDKVLLMGMADLGVGTHTINLEWQGDSSMAVYKPKLRTDWFYK